jgi:hypothetical protein
LWVELPKSRRRCNPPYCSPLSPVDNLWITRGEGIGKAVFINKFFLVVQPFSEPKIFRRTGVYDASLFHILRWSRAKWARVPAKAGKSAGGGVYGGVSPPTASTQWREGASTITSHRAHRSIAHAGCTAHLEHDGVDCHGLSILRLSSSSTTSAQSWPAALALHCIPSDTGRVYQHEREG